MDVKSYIIVQSYHLEDFQDEINEALKSGFVLYGHPFEWHGRICQGMVQYDSFPKTSRMPFGVSVANSDKAV